MFSSYWGDVGGGGIKDLNDWLEERTKGHLENLTSERSYPTTGSNKYTVALINKMTSYSSGDSDNKLKKEPDFKTSRTNVSWHADSSLQNFSSIAVYQTVVDSITGLPVADDPKASDDDKWRVALKVVLDAEGPTMKTRGTNVPVSSLVPPNAPPAPRPPSNPAVALPLPNGSAYYLLDDFNHHHQHAVLSPSGPASSPPTVRYSSTHRLIRKAGHVGDVLSRLRSALKCFNKKGLSVFRNELMLWEEVEGEWIRQFYVQGKGHRALKWGEWGGHLGEMVGGWERLEGRVLEVLVWLRRACMGK
ncbi:hypothetical protein TrRE_jg4755, partial [Triparma retinervis]